MIFDDQNNEKEDWEENDKNDEWNNEGFIKEIKNLNILFIYE